jgi:hypothetical protein
MRPPPLYPGTTHAPRTSRADRTPTSVLHNAAGGRATAQVGRSGSQETGRPRDARAYRGDRVTESNRRTSSGVRAVRPMAATPVPGHAPPRAARAQSLPRRAGARGVPGARMSRRASFISVLLSASALGLTGCSDAPAPATDAGTTADVGAVADAGTTADVVATDTSPSTDAGLQHRRGHTRRRGRTARRRHAGRCGHWPRLHAHPRARHHVQLHARRLRARHHHPARPLGSDDHVARPGSPPGAVGLPGVYAPARQRQPRRARRARPPRGAPHHLPAHGDGRRGHRVVPGQPLRRGARLPDAGLRRAVCGVAHRHRRPHPRRRRGGDRQHRPRARTRRRRHRPLRRARGERAAARGRSRLRRAAKPRVLRARGRGLARHHRHAHRRPRRRRPDDRGHPDPSRCRAATPSPR